MNPQSTFDEKLLRLIKNQHNNEEVKYIIEKKDLYNVTDSFKNTLLHKAVESRNAEITRYLVDSGSKVDAQNQRGKTPWMLAMHEQCEETVKILIEVGAMELQDNLGKSALQIIGDSPNMMTPALGVLLPKLQSVYSNNKEEIATKLIDANWPLQHVVDLKDSDLTRIVLQRGYSAKIDDFNEIAETALHEAIKLADVESVKVLLEYKVNVNLINGIERTSLWYVYGDSTNDRPKERLEILKMLLDHRAVIDYDFDDDYLAYDIFRYADAEAIKLLLQFHLKKPASFDKLTALEALIENENPGTIEATHGRGFDVNARNDGDETPLMRAARHGTTRAVDFLLNEGADINAVDSQKCSVIFLAIAQDPKYPEDQPKYEQCVQLLLERGADVQYEIVSPLRGQPRTIIDLIWRSKLFLLGDLVVDHLALQDSLGTPITKTIYTQINSRKRFKNHFESSKQQLSMKVYESTTLLDLLTLTTDEKFEKYARNEEFVKKCQDAVKALADHRYFHTILQRRLAKAQTISALKTAAARIISEIMGMSYDRFPLIADDIISLLTHEDMENMKNTLL